MCLNIGKGEIAQLMVVVGGRRPAESAATCVLSRIGGDAVGPNVFCGERIPTRPLHAVRPVAT